MPMIEFAGKTIALDEDGCLLRFEDWDENVAKSLAAHHGIGELSQEGMRMLAFIRDYYRSYDFFPILRSICRNVGGKKDCLHEQFINPLLAWKIAGLPHPDEPVFSLLQAGQSPG